MCADKTNIAIRTVLILLMWTSIASGEIAFVANVDGNWDLFSVDVDGSGLVRLTETPYDEKNPSWSSDGTKIVYATSDGHLNIVHTVTWESQRIAVDKDHRPKITPAFSPDEKEIAYAQFRPAQEGDDTDLMIFDTETKTSRRILDQYAIQMWPSWSPDGQRLVYGNMHCSADCGRLIQELWIADPRGGWARQLLMTHSFCQQPVWCPNGTRIAFSSDKSGNYDIWVLSLQDWRLDRITMDERLDVNPAWSPDGKRLAFVSTRSGIMEIWIKDLENGDLGRLRPFGDKDVECKDVTWNRR